MIERRCGSDRRKTPRGGRRRDDRPAHTPLVLLVGVGVARRARAAAALEARGYTVATCDGPQALSTATAMIPDVVVADVPDAIALRGRLPFGRAGRIPIVDFASEDADVLCERVRALAPARDRRF